MLCKGTCRTGIYVDIAGNILEVKHVEVVYMSACMYHVGMHVFKCSCAHACKRAVCSVGIRTYGCTSVSMFVVFLSVRTYVSMSVYARKLMACTSIC